MLLEEIQPDPLQQVKRDYVQTMMIIKQAPTTKLADPLLAPHNLFEVPHLRNKLGNSGRQEQRNAVMLKIIEDGIRELAQVENQKERRKLQDKWRKMIKKYEHPGMGTRTRGRRWAENFIQFSGKHLGAKWLLFATLKHYK